MEKNCVDIEVKMGKFIEHAKSGNGGKFSRTVIYTTLGS